MGPYTVQDILGDKLSTKDWGLPLVNARNEFNDINQIIMLWKVRHLWSSGNSFVLSCFCHW